MQNQEPIILCHVACSGGSMIYRMLVSNFDLVGISEVSHCYPFEKDRFIPTDPEHALLKVGELSDKEFERVFFDRIQFSNSTCVKNNKSLLIREHTHSYFFLRPAGLPIPDSPSWIAEQYSKRLGQQIKCIVTVRDPIDSWLGLCANFPGNAPRNFQDYCSKYEKFIRSYFNNYDQQNMLLIRYEDFVENLEVQLQCIAKFVGQPFSGKVTENWSGISCTGLSGRQNDKIEKRVRRPFGNQLLRDAAISESYRYLTEELGYPYLGDSVSVKLKAQAYYVDIRRKLATVLARVLGRTQKWALSRSRVP
ncbi:sulfotransferase [Pseudomonadota bacterium]